MSIKDWWNELGRPELTCARLGHRAEYEVREGYVKPSDLWERNQFVAMRIKEIRPICTRCLIYPDKEWKRIFSEGITGINWPLSHLDEFDSTGNYFNRHYIANATEMSKGNFTNV